MNEKSKWAVRYNIEADVPPIHPATSDTITCMTWMIFDAVSFVIIYLFLMSELITCLRGLSVKLTCIHQLEDCFELRSLISWSN